MIDEKKMSQQKRSIQHPVNFIAVIHSSSWFTSQILRNNDRAHDLVSDSSLILCGI